MGRVLNPLPVAIPPVPDLPLAALFHAEPLEGLTIRHMENDAIISRKNLGKLRRLVAIDVMPGRLEIIDSPEKLRLIEMITHSKYSFQMGLLDFLTPYTYYYTHRAGNVKRKSKKIFRQCATILGIKFV